MIDLRFNGPPPDCIQFEKGRLHLAIMAALHPDGGQLATMLFTDVENRPLGDALTAQYYPPPKVKPGAKPKLGKPVGAALYQDYLTVVSGIGKGAAATQAASRFNYAEDRSIRHALKRGRDELAAWGGWITLVGEIEDTPAVFVFHKSAHIHQAGAEVTITGDCWYLKAHERSAQHRRLRITAGLDPDATNTAFMALLKAGSN